VEGVHFDARSSPADVGYKAVAVSVSDLGATRARPEWMVLALSLPDRPDRDRWVEGLSRGLHEACARFGVYLVGGDVTGVPAGGPIFVSATLGGRLVDGPRTRSGARPGHDVWVTGWPGLAGAGWMSDDPPAAGLSALRRPVPPLAFALALDVASAAMDLSDGLAADLPRLCAASGVGAEIDPDALPVHPDLRARADRLRFMTVGGDDYELLFTAAPEHHSRIRELAGDVPVHRIGRIVAGNGARLAGVDWPVPAFSHFAAGES
jgi:thiamine-monophosphate kinase